MTDTVPWNINRTERARHQRLGGPAADMIRYLLEIRIDDPEQKIFHAHELNPAFRVYAIGRDGGCDIAISDPLVSRRHCLIERHPTYLLVEDTGSRNGTFVTGNTLDGQMILLTCGHLLIGDTLLFPADEKKRPFLSASSVTAFERQVVAFCRNIYKAAEVLGLHHRSLYRKRAQWRNS